jgi:uncharacterized membrane protein
MRSIRIPAVLFAFLCQMYLVFVFATAHLLPERVASHFDINGQPNGWMGRPGYLAFIAIMGVALPLFIVGLCYLSKFLPVGMINIPHRSYWLAPEHREQSLAYLFAHSMWIACLMVGFFGAMHFITVSANRSNPVHLQSGPFWVIMVLLLIGVLAWTLALYRRFRRPA